MLYSEPSGPSMCMGFTCGTSTLHGHAVLMGESTKKPSHLNIPIRGHLMLCVASAGRSCSHNGDGHQGWGSLGGKMTQRPDTGKVTSLNGPTQLIHRQWTARETRNARTFSQPKSLRVHSPWQALCLTAIPFLTQLASELFIPSDNHWYHFS